LYIQVSEANSGNEEEVLKICIELAEHQIVGAKLGDQNVSVVESVTK